MLSNAQEILRQKQHLGIYNYNQVVILSIFLMRIKSLIDTFTQFTK